MTLYLISSSVLLPSVRAWYEMKNSCDIAQRRLWSRVDSRGLHLPDGRLNRNVNARCTSKQSTCFVMDDDRKAERLPVTKNSS